MLIWIVRLLFLVTLAGAAAKITSEFSGYVPVGDASVAAALLFLGILGVGVVAIAVDMCYPRKRVSTISAVYFGLLVGSLLAHLMVMALGPSLSTYWDAQFTAPFSLVTTILLCYVCTSFLLQTNNDFRFLIPYVEFKREVRGEKPLVLDSSAVVDGRIVELARTGLLGHSLVVPRFVLDELNAKAHHADRHHRNRGKRGLDMIKLLQQCPDVNVEIYEEEIDVKNRRESDRRLIEVADTLDGRLITTDGNLVKSATIQGVKTVNVNAASMALKPIVDRGASLPVQIVREGEEPGQGIGYLSDGTMVVAEGGKRHVGGEVNLVVTSVLQTQNGRMVFGRIDAKPQKSETAAAG